MVVILALSFCLPGGWCSHSFCRSPWLCCPCPKAILHEGSPPLGLPSPAAPDGLACWVLLGSEVVKEEAAV